MRDYVYRSLETLSGMEHITPEVLELSICYRMFAEACAEDSADPTALRY